MAEILPFPSTRRVGASAKLAGQMAEMSPSGAENLLAARLKRHADALQRKGVASDAIVADVKAFENAVRAALWGEILGGRA